MFTRVKDFVYRHRNKFLIGGVVIGGAALLSRYAERKLLAWHDRQTRTLVEQQKRRQHYDNTLRTSSATVLSLAISVKEVINKELDSDALLQALREQPEHKRDIWEQLKIIGFSRAVAAIYVGSLVAASIRVQLMILGGYTFRELMTGDAVITRSLQQKYISAVHYLVEQGVPRLLDHLSRAVTHLTSGLPLNRSVTLAQLEAIFHEIRLALAGEGDGNPRFKTTPWSHYVLADPTLPESDSEEDQILYNMLIETSDILNSDDFNSVMDILIQSGINVVLDRMADFYPEPKVENWVDNITRNTNKGVNSISYNQNLPQDFQSSTKPDGWKNSESCSQNSESHENSSVNSESHQNFSVNSENHQNSGVNSESLPPNSENSQISSLNFGVNSENHQNSDENSEILPPNSSVNSETSPSNSESSKISSVNSESPIISKSHQNSQSVSMAPNSQYNGQNLMINGAMLNNSVLAVAKLVPVLSGLIHGALSPTPGQLLQNLLTNDKLDTLGANVYEAFAATNTEVDGDSV